MSYFSRYEQRQRKSGHDRFASCNRLCGAHRRRQRAAYRALLISSLRSIPSAKNDLPVRPRFAEPCHAVKIALAADAACVACEIRVKDTVSYSGDDLASNAIEETICHIDGTRRAGMEILNICLKTRYGKDVLI